jgi:putative addiction module CopG family antidote
MATVTLSDRDIQIVKNQMMSGRFDDMQDVIHAALELLDEQERYARLKAEIRIAREQHDRGEGIPYSDDWFQQVKTRAHQRQIAGDKVSDAVTL